MVRIGFEETLYTVSEDDGTAVVNVAVLSGTLSSDVVVTLETSDDDAAGKLRSTGLQYLVVCLHVYISHNWLGYLTGNTHHMY